MTFKGVVPLGLRFVKCQKLRIVGNTVTTGAILKVIDPKMLKELVELRVTVTDAEEILHGQG